MREREYHGRSKPDGKVPYHCQANAWRGLCQRELPTVPIASAISTALSAKLPRWFNGDYYVCTTSADEASLDGVAA
jgi:hypothetical protein